MTMRNVVHLIALLMLSDPAFGSEPTFSAIPAPSGVVTDEARQSLQRMSAFLAEAKTLSYEADVTYDVVLGDGQKIEFGSRTKAAWRRPGQLRVEETGDELSRLAFIDRGRFAFVNLERGIFVRDKVPEDLDAALDYAFQRLGISVPISDFVYSDPYAALIESAEWGRRVGVHAVRGVPCTHLAFVAEGLDWQIWIEEGDRPVPRKLVIDYKHEPGSPTYSAVLEWRIDPKLDKDFAVFVSKPTLAEVEIMTPAVADPPSGEEQ